MVQNPQYIFLNLLFEKIGVSHLINEEEFKKNLEGWNDYIIDVLKK